MYYLKSFISLIVKISGVSKTPNVPANAKRNLTIVWEHQEFDKKPPCCLLSTPKMMSSTAV